MVKNNTIKLVLLLAVFMGLTLPRECFGEADFYVAPGGRAAGSGSIADPWDLTTAFNHPAALKAGATLWLRGGRYLISATLSSRLAGTADNPILVRSYPEEWAVLDFQQSSGDGLRILGSWTVYRDLELMSSLVARPAGTGGLGFHGHHNSLINSVVHNTGNNAPHGNGNVIYGCLFYFNGGDGSGLGHAMYIQNKDPVQPAIFEDNIIWGSYAFGIHAYAGGVGLLNGLHFIGNVAFINGAAQTVGNLKDNYLIGGVNGQQNVLLRENMGWAYTSNTRSVALGRYSEDKNKDITLHDNYFVGTTQFFNQWESIVMTGNTFYGPVTWEGSSMAAQFPDNNYLTAAPVENRVFMRANRHEPGRAHIVVYNWQGAESVAVDIGALMPIGAQYELRNAQNYFGPPVLTGTYGGGALAVPVVGLTMAEPLSSGLIAESEKTGRQFNVFILRKLKSSGPTPTPTTTAAPGAPRRLRATTG